MHARILQVSLLCSLASAAYGAPDDAWPQWQADAQHSGAVHRSLLVGQRRFAWSEHARTYAITGMAATNAYVVTTDTARYEPYNSQVATLGVQDIADGHTLWSVSFAANVAISAPSCADGKAFVIENQYVDFDTPDMRYIDAFDLATGALVWRQPLVLTGGVFDAPTVAGGHVYYESRVDPHWYASDLENTFGSVAEETGLPEWQSTTASGDGFSPSVFDGSLYGATATLNVLDASTGQTTATLDNPDDAVDESTSTAPAIAGGFALAVQNGTLVAFDLALGSVAWTAPGYGFGQVSTDGHDAFFLSASALMVRDVATGSLLWGWEPPNGGPVNGGGLSENMIVTDSHVIVTDGVKTYFLDRSTHLAVGSYSISGMLAYAADRLLVADGNGIVTAIAVPTDELFSGTFE